MWFSNQSTPLIMLTYFPTRNATLRDELMAKMTAISRLSYANEPGVHKYGLLVPQDESDQKTMYSFEQYTSQDVFNSHLNTPEVKNMFSWVNSTNLFEKNPTVHRLAVLGEGLVFAKPELAQALPYLYATEQPRNASMSAGDLQSAVSAVQKDAGTLLYGLYTENNSSSKVVTIGAYKNASEAHGGREATRMKLRAGFLYKPSA